MNQPSVRKRGFDRVKAAEAAVAVLLLALLAVFIAGFIPLSHPLLTAKVAAFAKKTGADTCAIGKVRAAVWKGVSLHDVVMAGSFAPGRRYSLRAHALSLDVNCARMLLRQAAIRKTMARETAGLGEALIKEPLAALQRLFISVVAGAGVRGMGAEKTDILLTDTYGDLFSGQGMTVHVSADSAGGYGFRGAFTAARLGTRGVDLLGATNADFSSDGVFFTLSRCRARFFEGKMRCDARLDLSRGWLAGGTVSVNGCDIDKWYTLTDTTNGRCRGKADCRIALDPGALAVDSLAGKGSLSIAHFEISGFPFQKTLMSLLLYPPVMHLKFRKFKCDYSLKQGRIFVTDAVGEGDSLSIKASGTVSAGGRINEKIVCVFSKEAVTALPELAQKTFEDAPGGGRILRFRIYGPLANPKFEIESKVILQKAARNVFEDVRQNLQLWLKQN